MPWIAHLMILDDDPRVLGSLVPSVIHELARGLDQNKATRDALRGGDAAACGPLSVKVTAHGFESERVRAYRHREPHQIHLHLVREVGGRFDLARRLLNEQLFAVIVSDLRFSDDAGGQRAGQLFVDEAARVHPEAQGLLYSAYPMPKGFPSERFVRKSGEASGGAALADAVVAAVERFVHDPAIAAFVRELADQGMIHQSERFGTTLAQLFDLARLLGPASTTGAGVGRARRPLPCVLLDGESGTGKRGLAAAFHAASERRAAPFVVASCNELTNETLLRSILFGHKRGAFTDAREDRAGLVATAAKGTLLLDDFHRLPPACSAILHSFLEDGEYSRLGEEEVRRHADCAAILTVETGPWAERRRSGELPLAFLARVERLPLAIPPLRERPEDIEAQSKWICRALSTELKTEIELTDDALARIKLQPFSESNSRELRNVIERAVYRHYRETDQLDWPRLEPFVNTAAAATESVTAAGSSRSEAAAVSRDAGPPERVPSPTPAPNEWQRRLRSLASKVLAKGSHLPLSEAESLVAILFDVDLPHAWASVESIRAAGSERPLIPLPVWEDLWRCFAVSWLGGPVPAEKVLGIPANTLRQWISDRESR